MKSISYFYGLNKSHAGRNVMSPALLKKNCWFWFKCYTCLLTLSLFTAGRVTGQMYSENDSRRLIIRSGLKGAIGYSSLHLDDAVRPFYTTSEYYSFSPDLCAKVGAIITLQPCFLSEKFQVVFDPAFAKYSYGNYKEVTHENIVNLVDIDYESLEFPLSLRYSFLSGMHTVQPFIRGGYSFSVFIDTEAYFRSKEWNEDEVTDYETTEFDYARYQDAISLILGVEFNMRLVDYTVEVVFEKGDGIHKEKFGNSFLKISSTTSVYLQLGVLF